MSDDKLLTGLKERGKMRVIAVDDDKLSLEVLKFQLEEIQVFEEVLAFQSPREALEYVKSNRVDMAFLDIVMDEMDGITLAGAIKTFRPSCHVIIVSGSKEFAFDAYRVHADGYILKPVSRQMIQEELDVISSLVKQEESKKIRVQCFGNFEVFDSEGIPLKFRYRKSKELFAYLVHRNGAVCTNAEIAAVLYEDWDDNDSLRSQIRNLVADVVRVMKKLGTENIIYKERGGVAIVPAFIECDYYEFIQGDETAIRSFGGEYMTQYEWADVTAAYLISR